MPIAKNNRTRRLLLGVLVIEALVVLGSWWALPLERLTQPAAMTAATGEETTLPALATPPLASFSALAARPLFVAARRPVPRDTSSGSKIPPGKGVFLGHYRLNGIVYTPKLAIAFITDLNTSRNMALKEGEKLGDWTLTKIEREQIQLDQGARSESFSLPRDLRGSSTP